MIEHTLCYNRKLTKKTLKIKLMSIINPEKVEKSMKADVNSVTV